MKNNKKNLKQGLLSALVVLLLPALLLLWGREGAALLAAGLAVPGSGIEAIFQNKNKAKSEKNSEENKATESKISSTQSTQKPEPESIVQTQPSANNSPQRTDSEISTKAPDLSVTPADISALAAKAEANATKKKQGDVLEVEYSKSGSTDVFGNVRVKNTTETKSVNIKKELAKTPDIEVKDKKKPAVLIFHTHTTESFALFERDYYTSKETGRSNDPARNMVRVGREIASQLEQAGYSVIHDTTIHDEMYNGAYTRSRPTVEKHLKENPDIQIVLDIHRDAMHSEKVRLKPVVEINGKKAAQLMIVTGAEEGFITDYKNWKGNLTFALHLQKNIADKYPALARPVFFCQRVYNMNLGKNNLLVEIGSDANTLEEAAYTGRLLGDALVDMLKSS